jgi:hypothetical protein
MFLECLAQKMDYAPSPNYWRNPELQTTLSKNGHLFMVTNLPAVLGYLLFIRKIVGNVRFDKHLSVV